jgi:hypothetical protein
MWVSLLLFLFYALVCSYLILRIPIIKQSGIAPKVILALFIIKLIGGLCYHYINTVRCYGGDSHGLFLETETYLKTAISNPSAFWRYFFLGWSGFHFDQNIFSQENAASWSNLGNQINYRFSTIANFLSFSHEAVNYIFYNFIFFIGQIALFRVFAKQFPSRKSLILLVSMLLPSIWFWCSGVHKDGFVLSFIGLFLYYYYQYLQSYIFRYKLYAGIFLLFAILIRFYLSISLLPCAAILIAANYFPKKATAIFGLGLLFYLISFFGIATLLPSINPPAIIIQKQEAFSLLKGESFIDTPTLLPTTNSFIKNLPTAFNHCLMRPYIWEAKDTMYFLCALETMMIFILLVLLFIKIKKESYQHPLFLFCISFSLIMFIIIGYIVPFSGAFIRYRSEYYPFIFSVFIGCSNWTILEKLEEKLKTFIFL